MRLLILTCFCSIATASHANVDGNDLGDYVKKDEFISALNKLDAKMAEMQDYISNLEASADDQRRLNDLLSGQIVELQKENTETKNRLSKLQAELTRNSIVDSLFSSQYRRPDASMARPGSTKENDTNVNANDSNIEKGRAQTNTETRAVVKPDTRNSDPLQQAMKNYQHPISHQIHERQTAGSVAFSLFVKSDITNLGKDQIIKFDGIMVNDGSGYDSSTGIFTAPTGGLYLFSFFVEDWHDQDLWVLLKDDGNIRSKAVAEPYEENQNIMGGNTVLLHLRTGSKIWLAISNGNRVQAGCSTLSGVLLH